MPLIRNVIRRLGHRQMTQLRQYTQIIEPVNLAYRLHTTNPQPDDDADISSPVIVMHGVLGHKDNWRSISGQLAYSTGRRVFSVDARNHGDSPYTNSHSTQEMAADIVEFMKTHKLAKICAMGHSMGGRCMMMLALQHPELVDRAIIVDIPPLGEPTHFHLINAILEVIMNIHLPRDKTRLEAEKILIDEIKKHTNDIEGVKLILKNLRKRKDTGKFVLPANVKAVRNSWTDFSNFRDNLLHLPPYMGPVLFIAGKHSKFFQTSNLDDIHKWFPNAQLKWLNANHVLHHEDPKGFLKIVVEFLNTKFTN